MRLTGDWEAWLESFAEAIEQMANNAVLTAKELIALAERDLAVIQQQGRFSGTLLQIHHLLLRRPVMTAARVKEVTELAPATIQSGLQKLEGLNILQELTGKQRDRVYAYGKYIDILNQGNELP